MSTFFRESITDKDIPYIIPLKSLEILDLSGTKISDQGLIYLKSLKRLESLDLSETKISDQGLSYLKSLTSLKRLYLSGTKISNRGLIYLKSLKGLKTLHLSGTKITSQGLYHLKSLKNLKILILSGTKINDQGLFYLALFNNLKVLDLSGTKIGNQGLLYLALFNNLKLLDLSGTKTGNQGLFYLTLLNNLKSLDLTGTKISDQGLIYIKHMKNLKRLSLGIQKKGSKLILTTKITSKGLVYLRGHESLTDLYLMGTKITLDEALELKKYLPRCSISIDYDDVEILKRLREIKEYNVSIRKTYKWLDKHNAKIDKLFDFLIIDLSGRNISDEELKHLIPLRGKLYGLDLSGTKITDKGLKYLKYCYELSELTLGGRTTDKYCEISKITDKGLVHLKGLSLERVYINGTRVTERGVSNLYSTLSGFSVIYVNGGQFRELYRSSLAPRRFVVRGMLARVLHEENEKNKVKSRKRIKLLDNIWDK